MGNYNARNNVIMAMVDASNGAEFYGGKRKASSIESLTPHDIWKLQFNSRKTKLIFLLLTYLYAQDDGEISSHENKSIKKILKKNMQFLLSTDYDEILLFASSLPDYSFVIDYLSKNKVNNELLLESIQSVKKIIRRKKVYLELLSDLNERISLDNS
jgi:hypothetical protein